MTAFLFYLFGVGAVFSGANVVLRRQAVPAAIWLVSCFFFLAGEYLLLGFPFLAAIQIMVYVGAIMVLFLFVIMLLDMSALQPLQSSTRKAIASIFALILSALALVVIFGAREAEVHPAPEIPAMIDVLFTKFLLPFEITSALLVAAIVGALTLGRSPGSPVQKSRQAHD